jgi:hypothetical protein
MSVLVVVSPESAFEIGRLLGYHCFYVFTVVALMAGIGFAFSRNPAVNRKSILGLVLVLGGWLVWILTTWVSLSLAKHLLAVSVVVLLSLGMNAAGVVLSIIGLVQIGKRSPRPKGRGRAITALVLGLLYLVLFAVVLAVVLLERAGVFHVTPWPFHY